MNETMNAILERRSTRSYTARPVSEEDLKAEEAHRAKAEAGGSDLPLDEAETLLSEDDPFLESDLPVTSLADGEDDVPQP